MGQQPFGDIPLFREIQKILSASEGPINLELARQVANAVAMQAPSGAVGDATSGRALSDALHAAATTLSGYTRLSLNEPMAMQLVDRRWWVDSTLGAWRWLLERLAERLGAGLATTEPGQREVLGQITPLLMGLQAGTLVGHLAREAIGRYDFPLVRDDDGQLFFVWPNADRLASEYGFERADFIGWLALRDAARHLLVCAVPWLARYQRSLLSEVVDSIEIDTSDLERRLLEMQSLEQRHEPLPIVQTERHRKALERLRSLLAVFDGYANHARRVVATSVVGDTSKIDEAIARHEASPSEAHSVLVAILGISIDRRAQAAGQTFCAAVAEVKGVEALNRVWEAPDNLPGSEEIRDPFAWIERVLG